LVGPVVGTPDVANKRFTLLGQTVQIGANTIFDNSSIPALASINDISTGNVLEVHGVLNVTTNAYDATRIERKSGALQYKIRGAVKSLDAAAGTFKIGSETISYPVGMNLPTGFGNDQIVRVKLQTAQVNNAWVATRIKSGVSSMGDRSEAELKGTVNDFNETAKTFTVSGISVDASKASIFPTSLGNGTFVEVEGPMVNNTLVARKVTLEDSLSSGAGEFEFHGRIEQLAGDHTNFVVHSVKVTVVTGANATVFARGATQANLVNGMCVEVKTNAAMNATYIKSDNDCAP
ncbi:MAG: DUF5666 domain-containing protein, partial [Burkholderiaceae bacterium]